MSSEEEISNVLENIISVYKKPPCILVNCAGIISDNVLLDMDEEKSGNILLNLKVPCF